MKNNTPIKNALYCDCETDLERAEFFATGRAYETGVIAASLGPCVARAFLALSNAGAQDNGFCPVLTAQREASSQRLDAFVAEHGGIGERPMIVPKATRSDRDELKFKDAVRIAKGCTDYGGGFRGTEYYDAYQAGIATVIASLTSALARGMEDSQIRALHARGTASELEPGT